MYDSTFHQVLFDMPNRCNIFFANISRIAQIKAPTKSFVNSLPTRIKFKITLFLLGLKKLL